MNVWILQLCVFETVIIQKLITFCNKPTLSVYKI